MVCKASAKCLISFSVVLALAERFQRGKVRIFQHLSYVEVSPPWQLETSLQEREPGELSSTSPTISRPKHMVSPSAPLP